MRHGQVFRLWVALDLVLLRYQIGEAIAQDQPWRAATILGGYADLAAVAVLP